MGNLLNPVISIGPVVLVLGLLSALACLLFCSFAAEPRKDASRLRYVLVVLAIGVVAFVAGTALGIAAFCSDPSSGNLCGLGGVFGVGPLLSGLCMGGYAYSWLWGARNAP
jgi:hypothetical protein